MNADDFNPGRRTIDQMRRMADELPQQGEPWPAVGCVRDKRTARPLCVWWKPWTWGRRGYE